MGSKQEFVNKNVSNVMLMNQKFFIECFRCVMSQNKNFVKQVLTQIDSFINIEQYITNDDDYTSIYLGTTLLFEKVLTDVCNRNLRSKYLE